MRKKIYDRNDERSMIEVIAALKRNQPGRALRDELPQDVPEGGRKEGGKRPGGRRRSTRKEEIEEEEYCYSFFFLFLLW